MKDDDPNTGNFEFPKNNGNSMGGTFEWEFFQNQWGKFMGGNSWGNSPKSMGKILWGKI